MRFWKKKKIHGNPHVCLVISAYFPLDLESARRWQAFCALYYSLLAQTRPSFSMTLVHDGPMFTETRLKLEALDEHTCGFRIIETPEREGQFGHKWRHWAVREHTPKFATHVGFTNMDNYYMPTYLEWLLAEMTGQNADFGYCDCVHSHRMWKPMTTQARNHFLDVGGFLASKELVLKTPWTDFSFKGDGTYINALVKNARKVVKIPATLFVHN